MQARSRVSLADEATVDTGRLIGCNEHANVPDGESNSWFRQCALFGIANGSHLSPMIIGKKHWQFGP